MSGLEPVRRTPADVRPSVRSGSGFALHPAPRDWLAGDPVKTRFLDALSLAFPAYEHFFIAVLNAARPGITDPTLKEEARAFCAQEGQHAAAHRRYNEALWARPGYERVQDAERTLIRLLRELPARLPRPWLLAIAAGGEHLTSFVAHEYLSHPARWSQGADPEHDALFRWHAGEEIEHKAVCFDALAHLAPSGWRRRAALMTVTLPTVGLVLLLQLEMLRADGLLGSARTWRQLLQLQLGRRGLLLGLAREHVRYFRPGFHPWDLDDRNLLPRAFARTSA